MMYVSSERSPEFWQQHESASGAAYEEDKRWFARHPKERVRERPANSFEIESGGPDTTRVSIFKLSADDFVYMTLKD